MSDAKSPNDALARAVEASGGQTALAKICGCTQGNIWQLIQKGSPLPAQYVLRVEAETGISRHELRPDLYPVDDRPPVHAEQTAPEWPVPASNNGAEIISEEQAA